MPSKADWGTMGMEQRGGTAQDFLSRSLTCEEQKLYRRGSQKYHHGTRGNDGQRPRQCCLKNEILRSTVHEVLCGLELSYFVP